MTIKGQIRELLKPKADEFFDFEKGKNVRDSFLHLIKEEYMQEIDFMHISKDEERFFSWMSAPAKLYVLLAQSADKHFERMFFFAENQKNNEYNDSIETRIFTVPEKDSYQFFNIYSISENVKYLISNLHENFQLVIPESIDFNDQGKKSLWLFEKSGLVWAQAEYKRAQSTVKKTGFQLEESLVKFNDSGLHANKYALQEVVKEINNPQFVEELNECLKAYELPMFYVCATGLGGIIESILSFSLGQYHIRRKNLPKDPTAYDYLQALIRNGLITDRQLKYLQSTFMLRNSVSHYNTGGVTSELCDRMMNSIQAIFKGIFLPSKEWDQKYGKPNISFEEWKKISPGEAKKWFSSHPNPFPHVG
ncbi:hypothetical protein EFP34_14915 [Lacticaseibacillus paracasei]|uniref:hypothetical protein n=1 Tax=Lacticaseibacillus paracasei TaxID=1597 RepID=UPI0021A57F86|nr:hypothetical protein [Lacticaseibacillus paracasei]MCT3351775.1 hypothetical protein [Lacticaseibacillus paracasei]